MKSLVTQQIEFQKLDDDITHIVCCDDDDLSICGEDVSGDAFVLDETNQCTKCVNGEISRLCPKGKICTGELDGENN